MRQRDQGSITDSDPHGLFFDSDDDGFFDDDPERPLPVVQRVSRSELRTDRGHRARRRRNRRFTVILAVLLVALLAVVTWVVVLPIYHYLSPDDYSGQGSGSVVVQVQPNDGAQAIGETLHDKGVVASVRAFTEAAKKDARAQNIQPGSYKLRHHMSAKNALNLLLTPAARIDSDVVVTEGATTVDIVGRLSAAPCASNADKSAICGPGMDKAAVTKAIENVQALGLPTDYTVNGKPPSSAEGFLYPATYFFPPHTSPSDALGQMISNFTDQARSTDFTAAAAANHVTPYQQLIIASIAQSEAKYPADMAKVARVILNRLASKTPLKVDATSVYAAKLKGLDPTKVIYSQVKGPYNTYSHTGLPPTPISNPGADAMKAGAHPTPGNWTYYVNGDAAGHLYFTNSETAFEKAVATCRAHHWGCG